MFDDAEGPSFSQLRIPPCAQKIEMEIEACLPIAIGTTCRRPLPKTRSFAKLDTR